MPDRCRVQAKELVAYQDGSLSAGRREIIESHLVACHGCKDRLSAFEEIDGIIRSEARADGLTARQRAALHDRLIAANREMSTGGRFERWFPQRRDRTARVLAVAGLLLMLTLPPSVGRADFPLDHFVRFGPIESTGTLPPEEQVAIRHAAPSDPDVPPPSFPVVAPLELPNGFHRVHWSTPGPERLEQLYRNDDGVDLLVTQVPAEEGMVTIEGGGADYLMVRDTPVLLTADVRPDSVMEMTWERDGVFVDVLVVEAPIGPYGGFRRADALQVVEAIMAAQDAGEDGREEERWADD